MDGHRQLETGNRVRCSGVAVTPSAQFCVVPGVSEMRQLHVKISCVRHELAINHVAITEEEIMSWKTPKIVEIALGAEINCYACADLK